MNHDKLREWMDSLIEGEISEAQFLQLEAELTVDDDLRKEYLDRVQLTTLLKAEAESISEGKDEAKNTRSSIVLPTENNHWIGYLTAAGLLFAVCAVGAIVIPRLWKPQDSKTEIVEAEATGYGVIRGQDAVVWQDQVARSNGSLLPTGEMCLTAGVVQLELFSGVSVVIEGPAKFSVTSPMNMDVDEGKIRAHVPEPAHGFRVSTRDGDVVDLGTEFAIDIGDTTSELHVLEGEVELHSDDKTKPRRVSSGQAVQLSGQALANVQADDTRFVGQDELSGRLQVSMKSRREAWLQRNHEFRADPRLIALYQVGVMDGGNGTRQNDRMINNRAMDSTAASMGTIVAATRTADRWQHQDGALDFSPTGSRVRLTIPGEHGSLTLMCWVKINSLDRRYNSLFLTDGHEQHEPHWQIMDDGRLFFSVKKRDQWDASKGEKDKHIYFSPPFWNTSLSGQWMMISTVYDVDKRLVTHFVNGRTISEEPVPNEYLVERVQIGNASLCNWSLPERDEPGFAVRNLNGCLDEFAMFGAALSPEDIQEIYDHGKP